MMVDTEKIVTVSDLSRNFSSVAKKVDEGGVAVVMKNNKPIYAIIPAEDYEAVQAIKAERAKLMGSTMDEVIEENRPALEELAK